VFRADLPEGVGAGVIDRAGTNRHQQLAVGELEVDVPRRWLRRSARKRLWYSLRDIPPNRIKRVFTFQEMAGASAEN
jgi:hypothetical protein